MTYDDSDWWHQLENEQELREYEEWLDSVDSYNEVRNMDMTKYAGSESKYLKASDLQGKRPTVIISGVNLLEFDDEDKGKQVKPALALEGKQKELVVNPTNCEELIRAFGADSDGWVGKKIGLSTKFYKNFGKEGIVITPILDEDPDDEIPF